MPGKKLLNSVERCVDENLEGLVAVHTGIRIIKGTRVAVRADIEDVRKQGKVTLLCGGGSGHEPAHAGYVGQGMLSAAVAGSIFTSPPPQDILTGLRAIARNNPGGSFVIVPNYTGDRLNYGMGMERAMQEGIKLDSVLCAEDCAKTSSDKSAAGALVIVKNYTGDRINFGLAMERAKTEGIACEMVVAADDCALTSNDKTAGRRGLCGTLFLHKIAGALAEEAKSLAEVTEQAQRVADNMGTIGLAIGACSVPGANDTLFHVKDDEMELGLGLHGEAGVKRMKLMTAKETVKVMIDHMTNSASSTHFPLNKGDKVACIINNLGGLSVLEINILANETIKYLEGPLGASVDRAYCDTFVTSMEMPGLSISLLHLTDTFVRCLDAPTSAPAWHGSFLAKGQTVRRTPEPMLPPEVSDSGSTAVKGVSVSKEVGDQVYDILQNVVARLVENKDRLNMLDTDSGDGDTGATIARGAQQIQEQLGSKASAGLSVTNPSQLSLELASIAESVMGGSSGGLYSLFFTAAATSLQKDTSAQSWQQAIGNGITAIQKYGHAEPGDRTMLDALLPAKETFQEKLQQTSPAAAFKEAAEAAVKGAEATKGMKARAGRASYVHADHLTKPDPGAVAVSLWLKAVADKLE